MKLSTILLMARHMMLIITQFTTATCTLPLMTTPLLMHTVSVMPMTIVTHMITIRTTATLALHTHIRPQALPILATTQTPEI